MLSTVSSRLMTLLEREVRQAGGMRAYARKHGMSASHIHGVLRGKWGPGPKVLSALGVTERRIYMRQNGEKP